MFFDSERPYHDLHECPRCGLLVALQHSYINKHGDIEQLCGYCYTEAIEGESPELARRDRIAAWVMAVIGGAALLVWLTGCATRPHTVETRMVAGKAIEIHTDAPSFMEPPCPEPWAGCHAGNWIFLRSAYLRPGMVEHELAHVEGMQHGDWELYQFLNARCAKVIAAGGKYKVGQLICNRRDGEVVFTDSTMREAV